MPTSVQDVTGTEKAAKLTEVNCNGDLSFSSDTEKEIFASRTPAKTAKRTDYLSWDEYFMAVAFLSAQRSKDPSSQVGACVVNQEKKIVGIGYNGMPNGCSDDELPWARHASDELETKYPYGKIEYLVNFNYRYIVAQDKLISSICTLKCRYFSYFEITSYHYFHYFVACSIVR